MQLTSRTDYALRLLIYLMLHEGEYVSVSQVSKAYGISTHHLSKVANDMTHLGWTHSRRGQGGGLILADGTAQLSVGDIVRALEHNFRIVECFGSNNTCPLSPSCQLKKIIYEASQAFLSVLDSYLLSTLVEQPDALRVLLSLETVDDVSQ